MQQNKCAAWPFFCINERVLFLQFGYRDVKES